MTADGPLTPDGPGPAPTGSAPTGPAPSTGPTPPSSTPEIHHEHRDLGGGWVRPAVFGAMDGLVSNFALMSGVAGGSDDSGTVVLAGLAGLAAGAFSMAAGEYTSVATETELALAEIEVERNELLTRPKAEQRELAQMLVSDGVEPHLADQVAAQLSRDPDRALDIHVRAELGIDPNDLPSPRVAATASFVSFSLGAMLPVVPYLFGATALWPAAVLAVLGLFVTGALTTRLTSRPWWYAGLRQLVLGSLAALVTFGIGTLVGTQV